MTQYCWYLLTLMIGIVEIIDIGIDHYCHYYWYCVSDPLIFNDIPLLLFIVVFIIIEVLMILLILVLIVSIIHYYSSIIHCDDQLLLLNR